MASRLDKYTIRSKQTISFSDIPLNFDKNLDTNDLIRVTNDAAVKRSIRNLLETNRFERFFQPTLGGDIRQLLFEQATPQTEQALRSAIEGTIRNFEPRAELIDVFIQDDSDNNRYQIDITFKVVQVIETFNITIFLYRIR